MFFYNYYYNNIGEHQMELLDYVAAKFHEEMGTFKLLVSVHITCVFKFKQAIIIIIMVFYCASYFINVSTKAPGGFIFPSR